MPRARKVSLKKGPQRLVTRKGIRELVQTRFCGECGKRVKTAYTQSPIEPVAYVCDKIELHKNGRKYFWPFKKVTIITA